LIYSDENKRYIKNIFNRIDNDEGPGVAVIEGVFRTENFFDGFQPLSEVGIIVLGCVEMMNKEFDAMQKSPSLTS